MDLKLHNFNIEGSLYRFGEFAHLTNAFGTFDIQTSDMQIELYNWCKDINEFAIFDTAASYIAKAFKLRWI